MHVSHVQLRPDGLAHHQWDPSGPDDREQVTHVIRPSSFAELAPFLDAEVSVAPGTTLQALFDAVDVGEDTVLLDVLFGPGLQPYLDIARRTRAGAGGSGETADGPEAEAAAPGRASLRRPSAVTDRAAVASASARGPRSRGPGSLGALVLGLDEHEVLSGLLVANDFDTSTGPQGEAVHGVRRVFTGLVDPANTRRHVPVDMLPLERLLPLPLQYDSTVRLWRTGDAARQGQAPVFEGHWSLTLAELLRTVFWELTFQGSPEERAAMAEALVGV